MRHGGYVLGVDGGASKTVALVARCDDGTVVGAGRSGNADIYQTTRAESHVADAIAQAVADAAIAPEHILAATLSLVGADWPEDFEHWHSKRAELGLGCLPAQRFSVVNDGIGGLESLSEAGAAVAVVCGTGAAVSARSAGGVTWHSSFWQRTQGAVELAEAALEAVYLAELGIGPATALTAEALAHFGVADVEALLHRFTGRMASRPAEIGYFAPRLVRAAEEADPVARDIVLTHADKLADYARVAARKVGIASGAPVTLLLSGGVFQSGSELMKDRVWQIFQGRFPAARREEANAIPVVGAVALALDLADATRVDRHTITSTLPDRRFFQTTGRNDGDTP
ncbi:BadF/BadG/BcrA/BcrD ATPase family protein [Thalassorhabdomicrobium marinisediminis]|uniref:ATPase BadF/BadG/BcrA/BcrD type domain-containing protein n=1 Tax=Thalassorhabdomicrobium marinisediminis TaxID=2170577 RepID=A0A2T7FT56_9RHOB|nr:BadF/BadG/BcrA/BcrD ATPase family protein [Thalassorhabdomicrobium marinisediminis]PVA05357.1 hypothetical protein DC363_15170 [Thalassorhabdomicrobium marinisediminis]